MACKCLITPIIPKTPISPIIPIIPKTPITPKKIPIISS